MEIARHAEELEGTQRSIQLLQMPWNNIPSRQTSRQTSRHISQDPALRPPSRDSMHLVGGGGFRSSISRGFQDDDNFGQSSPPIPSRRIDHASGIIFYANMA